MTGSRRQSKMKFKKSDVKTLLVELYGSKEFFLKEYENYLAENILRFKPIDIREQQSNLNMLKQNLRLSSNLLRCNVLINDFDASRELSAKHAAHPYAFHIVSKSFWPINYDTESFSVESTSL